MATLLDVFSLLFTTVVVVSVVCGIALLVRKCSAAIDATKASLEKRGLTVSREGAVVQPAGKRRMDHERYLDVTQRGIVKAVQASSFGGPAPLSFSSSLPSYDDHPAVGVAAADVGGAEPVASVAAVAVAVATVGGSGEDTASEAGSERRRRRLLFRR